MAGGADLQPSGPALARVFDPRSHLIHQVSGAPGASLLAGALAGPFDSASIAPNGRAALALRDGRLLATWDLGGDPGWADVPASVTDFKLVAWDADGTAAAVYSPAATEVMFVTRHAVSRMALDGNVQSLMIARGPRLFAATSSGVYLLAPGNSTRPVSGLTGVSAMTASKDGRSLIVADRGNNGIFEVRNLSDTIPLIELAPDARITGLALAADGMQLFAVDATSRCLDTFDLATRTRLERIALPVDPAFLKPLDNGQFQINEPAERSTPFWLLDTNDSPRAYFVSAGGAQ